MPCAWLWLYSSHNFAIEESLKMILPFDSLEFTPEEAERSRKSWEEFFRERDQNRPPARLL
jgi:hypothetical protein